MALISHQSTKYIMYPLHLYAHRQTSDELEAQSENTTLHSGCIFACRTADRNCK